MSGRHRRERAPHEQDQQDAATREALRYLVGTAAAWGKSVEVQTDDVDPNAKLIADKIYAAVNEHGQMLVCKHLHQTSGPQPLFVRAWERPYIMRCQDCQETDRPPLTFEQDNTCDVCGRFDPTGIWPSQMLKGPVTIFMGRCDDCVPERIRNQSRG